MSKQMKIHACLTTVVAVLFYLFFQTSKQQPALSQVNAFANDPYDAIGSFGVQFALFTALLSLVRAFRPYRSEQVLDNQKVLLVRGTYLSCLSIAMTLLADTIAMLRHPSVWVGLPAGYTLAALTGGMVLVVALVNWLLHRWTRTLRPPSEQNTWIRAIGILMVSILILAVYPENWRQSTPGALLTIVIGAILLFVPIWAIGMAIVPSSGTFFEDFIDDLVSVYRWLKAHTGPFVVFCSFFEKIWSWPLVHPVLNWLNPRKHTWNLVILIGIVMGIMATLGETFGEGGDLHQIGRFALLATVFVSLECFAVLLGYALLAQPLGLFRRNSANKSHPVLPHKTV